MERDCQRRIVLISGPPASGKTTLARPLAEALGFALLTKDDIKESLFTSMDGPPGDLSFSRRLSDAAMHLLWDLAPHCPRLVLEANFRTQSAYERGQLAALMALPGARLVEVFCRVPLEDAARRFAQRARDERHPAHALREMPVDQLAAYAQPFALTSLIEVDTSRPVDADALLERVRTALAAEPATRPCGG
jgi:predicted kinase